MSDIAKWALLVAGAVAIVALIMALPFVEFINVEEFASLITELVATCGEYFQFARGLINNFLTPFGRTVLSGLIFWLFGKWAIMIGIKIATWVYHWIFK